MAGFYAKKVNKGLIGTFFRIFSYSVVDLILFFQTDWMMQRVKRVLSINKTVKPYLLAKCALFSYIITVQNSKKGFIDD